MLELPDALSLRGGGGRVGVDLVQKLRRLDEPGLVQEQGVEAFGGVGASGQGEGVHGGGGVGKERGQQSVVEPGPGQKEGQDRRWGGRVGHQGRHLGGGPSSQGLQGRLTHLRVAVPGQGHQKAEQVDARERERAPRRRYLQL
jgi:hypothetical protein